MSIESMMQTAGPALDHILNSAVILNWNAFGGQPEGCTVKVEYHVGQNGTVENLRLWVQRREYWSLICDYTPNAGWSDGPRFANGFHSRNLARLLQSILMNQALFRLHCSPNSNATFEVRTPTLEDIGIASERVSVAFPIPMKTAENSRASRAILPKL